MMRLAEHAGLPWTTICGAGIAQTFKPEPVVYEKSCATLGCDPIEVVMIACHADDLDAAAACGLMTGYFPRPLEWGPNGYAPIEEPERFSFHAGTLTALVDDIIATLN